MSMWRLALLLVCLCLVVSEALPYFTLHSVSAPPRTSKGSFIQSGMEKKGLGDGCGCNVGCFYSSARECVACCVLAL